MSNIDIERAWRDRTYRSSLSEEERQEVPDHPSGPVELPDELLPDGGEEAFPSTWICGTASVLASCWINCDTVVKGTCGAFSVGCCGSET